MLELLGWPTTCRSRARRATRTSPTTCSSPTPAPRSAPRPSPTPPPAPGTPPSWRRASASACHWTSATGRPGFHARSPHSQILRYLATAEIESESRLRWGAAHQRPRLAPLRLPRPGPGPAATSRPTWRDLLALRLRRGPARLPPALPAGVLHAAGGRRRLLPRGGPGRGPPLRGAGRPGSLGSGPSRASSRQLVQALADEPPRREGEGPTCRRSTRRRSSSSTACSSCSTPRTGGLLPVNDSRYDDYGPAQAGARRRGPQNGGERHLLGRGQQLLRPPSQPLPHHRPGRPVHRPASLQRGPFRPGRPRPCWRPSAFPTPPSRP